MAVQINQRLQASAVTSLVARVDLITITAMRLELLKYLVTYILRLINSENFITDLQQESNITTITMVQGYGYPLESHTVTTVDGYILTIFRIPYSLKHDKETQLHSHRPVVFLMHGFGSSSTQWVLNGSPRSLGFYLSDRGYDVWMGNARGTRYSRKHIKLDPNNFAFWNYSWHEIGLYDLPANIAYILKNTSQEKLHFIANSQGAMCYLVAASLVPSFNDKLISAHLLSPVSFLTHTKSPLVPVIAPLLGIPNPFSYLIGGTEVWKSSALSSRIVNDLCVKNSPTLELCKEFSSLSFGRDSVYTNVTALRMFFASSAGGSTKQIIHFLQNYRTVPKFRQFDYGRDINKQIYHQTTPPDYPLENITASTYLYYSDNDALADPEDVHILISRLNPTIMKRAYRMRFKTWNHIDFIIANKLNETLFPIILGDIRSEYYRRKDRE